ncbi:hypothetical protein ES703_82480 [subsurface metagenome]
MWISPTSRIAVTSILSGFVLLFISKSRSLTLMARWRSPFLWLVLTALVLFVFYFLGPQTAYCQRKLLGFVMNLTMAAVAFLFIAKDENIDVWHLGLLAILSSVVYYSAILYTSQGLVPDSIWTTGGLRIGSAFSETAVATNTLALVGCAGIVFMLSAFLDKRLSNPKMVLAVLSVFVGFTILNSAGQRLFLVIPVVSAGSLVLCRPIRKKYFRIISIVTISICAIIIGIGLQTENPYISSVFESNRSFYERVSRSVNWNAAILRIQEKPLFGHGLGGYYIDGYSYSGSGTYPHNMFLELLSETGIIGTALILLPVLFFILKYNKRILLFRTASKGTLTPLLIMTFLHAMISHDLTRSSTFFALMVVMWAFVPMSQARDNSN